MARRIMGVPAFAVHGQYIVGLDWPKIEEALKHQVFPCPQCGRSLKTPAGRGKLRVTCPDCGHQFIKE